MSLRARLAVLYTAIVGGILLIFGVAVYASVSFSLISQVDAILQRTVEDIWPNLYVNSNGELVLRPSRALDLAPGLWFQLWGRNNTLISQNVSQFTRPFDPVGLQVSEPTRRDVTISTEMGAFRLRVLSTPLTVGQGNRIVGALQVATSLAVVDATQRALLRVLLFGAVISMIVAWLVGWISTRQALAPLGDVTDVALMITRADDLSRRIPYQGSADDEVGQLIQAFNQTLSRLENLFHTQRRFLADVGHELRTPLTVIRGNVDLMRRMGTLDSDAMESIESEVARLTRMVGDLLLLAQAESGKLPLNLKVVEIDTILFEVMHQMRVLAGEKVDLKFGEIDQVLVCGDTDRLKQVFVNLISNAIKYTPSGGEVVVGLGKQMGRARVTVRDNGSGIPPEDLPHIFERFYRGEKSRTRQRDGKGFGLGLSIAYWIVRSHGGQIEVDSKPEMGTTFCVWLPLADGVCESKEEDS